MQREREGGRERERGVRDGGREGWREERWLLLAQIRNLLKRENKCITP